MYPTPFLGQVQFLDLSVIIIYLAAITLIGVAMSRRASRSMGDYYLGGNRLPWYALGVSNASGMFDISGTMWLVTLAFVYGMKSIWVPWLWPVFNQIFLMMFLSAWIRRSGVTTGAQWIGFRFGNNRDGKLAHGIVVAFAVINGLGLLAYGFVGMGKFIEIFIPWEWVNSFLQWNVPEAYVPHLYGIFFTIFAVVYTILGGMSSIVWADVLQYVIMTITSILIAAIAIGILADNPLVVPEGWANPFFGLNLDIDWSGTIDEVNSKIAEDGYMLFSAMFMMMLFKGVLMSLAGPAPTYDLQKILSTRTPSEACKMSGMVSAVLMPVRYLLIAGVAAIGIVHYEKLDLLVAGVIDFEQIMPSVTNEFIPAGLLGLLLAGLLAAFISTFSGTLNAVQVYLANDIYLRYVNPKASAGRLRVINYSIGIAVVLVSIVLGMGAKNINQVLQLIVSALWGGYAAANVLKWYWWRFNAYGYFWGMIAGLVAAGLPVVFPSILETVLGDFAPDIRVLYFFPVILVASTVGCLLGSFLTRPTAEAVLVDFYSKTRPWGFWRPILDRVRVENPAFEKNRDFPRDMLNVAIGIVWQTALVALPMFLVFGQYAALAATVAVIVVTSVILKKTWWDRLPLQDRDSARPLSPETADPGTASPNA